jgi:UDP-N-acetylmuramoyl-L-alanyl-D-glutamate--2,6-diaminopimelate ligase
MKDNPSPENRRTADTDHRLIAQSLNHPITQSSDHSITQCLASLAKAIGVSPQPGWESIEIAGISEDSRLIHPGFLFVAIGGFITDGHRYIEDAIARGAVAIVGEKNAPCSVPFVRVDNGREALAHLSAAFFSHPTRDLFTVGVTGTNGKTTVCHLVAHLLGEERSTLISTVTNEARNMRAVTTPTSPLIQQIAHEALAAEKENIILEVSSAALLLHRVDSVDFDVAVFTNLTHDHLDFHDDRKAYLEAKLLLFRNLDPGATAIVNTDDPAANRVLAASTGHLLTYNRLGSDLVSCMESSETPPLETARLHKKQGLTPNFCAEEIRYAPRKTLFTLRVGEETQPIELHLPGEHNVYNALAAAAVATVKGMTLTMIAERLRTARSVEGRYQFFRAKNGTTAIVDFAHSPDSLEKMLLSLRPYHDKVICVFGCGGESDRKKRPLMGTISGALADMTILTCDNPKTEDPEAISAEIEAGLLPTGGRYEKIVDRRDAILRAIALAGPKDVILIAGKGHEPYQIIGHEFVPYSDAGVLHEAGLVS